MRSNIIKHTFLLTIFLLAASLNTYAGYLDDVIKADEKIEDWDTIDRPGINIK